MLSILMTLPIWFAMMQWRPALPLNGKPKVKGFVPTVDIAVCTYKEDINDVVDTIVATQRVEYQTDRLHVYLLDDGRRPEMEEACAELKRSGLLRYQLTYVNRPTNKGYKGGNINNWFEVYKEKAAEFFIILDADMQPFPDMMDIFMGHYFGLSEEEQERVAFIQTPQWYRNFNKSHGWTDFFFISEFFFYRILQPANSFRGCAIYCGCCGLWSRRAIDSIGGFTEGFATEDSVTGCAVIRNKVPGKNYNWIAKFVSQPVAVGVSPDTLPALMAQRLRWYHGMMQMFQHHNYYLFAKGLTPYQKLMFWVGCAGWIVNLVNYVATMVGTLLSLLSIAAFAYQKKLHTVEVWAFWVGPVFLVVMFLIFTLNPGCTWVQYFHTMSTAFMYTPVYAAAALKHYFGLNIKVQATAVDDNGARKRWCSFYTLPVVSITIVILAAGVATWQLVVSEEANAILFAFHIPFWIGFWMFVHNHSLLAMMGYAYTSDEWYELEADGELCNPEIQRHLDRHRIQGGTTVRDTAKMEDIDYEPGDPRYVVMYNKLYQGEEDASKRVAESVTSSETSVIDAETTLGRLNLQIARRIAINEDIETHHNVVEESPRFERKFLGRASNQTYHNERLEKAKAQKAELERAAAAQAILDAQLERDPTAKAKRELSQEETIEEEILEAKRAEAFNDEDKLKAKSGRPKKAPGQEAVPGGAKAAAEAAKQAAKKGKKNKGGASKSPAAPSAYKLSNGKDGAATASTDVRQNRPDKKTAR
jgi:cellulose synthase/poly-beta-1,6-N-acetylglucosamine synthase-like glycosyltransferase